MCFRPSAVNIEKKCPECGTVCQPADASCSQCGATLPVAGVAGAPSTPATPGVPKAPSIPVAPGSLQE
ncbi:MULTISPECIES: hypothetical protein [Gordonibacter]|uniref:Zinc-ribbon domain-containing protein n=1 Tax=Gordonibacter faecis TaxID=3047475 RepID=A0ABT7DKH8_9ACTN|nr:MULTISPECIES: hypothetical protein [unclassified Gordonibacter]MDJ1649897.1 hypothetical protein [Gordonibacter sp. KGMB12511]